MWAAAPSRRGPGGRLPGGTVGRQLVDGHRGEQRLQAGHQHHREHGGGQGEYGPVRHFRQGVRAPGRQIDPGDTGRDDRSHRRSGHHRGEGSRNPAYGSADPARNPGPQDQDGDGQRSDEWGGRAHPAQLVGEREGVGYG